MLTQELFNWAPQIQSKKKEGRYMLLRTQDRTFILCLTLLFSLDLWKRLVARHGFKSPHTPLAPLLHNAAFSPGLHPNHFSWWMNKGLLCIADLYNHRGALSQTWLREQYQFPDSEMFRYLQLMNFLHSLKCEPDQSSSISIEHVCR